MSSSPLGRRPLMLAARSGAVDAVRACSTAAQTERERRRARGRRP